MSISTAQISATNSNAIQIVTTNTNAIHPIKAQCGVIIGAYMVEVTYEQEQNLLKDPVISAYLNDGRAKWMRAPEALSEQSETSVAIDIAEDVSASPETPPTGQTTPSTEPDIRPPSRSMKNGR